MTYPRPGPLKLFYLRARRQVLKQARALRDRLMPPFEPDTEVLFSVAVVPALAEGEKGARQLEEIFQQCISRLQPAVVVDVSLGGATDGMALLGGCAPGSIHIVDPLAPAHISDPQIAIHRVAALDQPGDIMVYRPGSGAAQDHGLGGAANRLRWGPSLCPPDNGATHGTFAGKAETLDAILSNLDQGNGVALKTSAGGFEALVLSGAKAVLANTVAVLLTVNGFTANKDMPAPVAAIDLLLKAGFLPVIRDRRFGDARFSVLMVHNSALDRLGALPAADAPALGSPAVLHNASPAPKDMPVIVPCFNNPTFCDAMLAQLKDTGFRDIRFIDNASTSQKMHRWLEEAEGQATVVRQRENLGPRISISNDALLAELPRYFCATDPDLRFNPRLPNDFTGALASLTARHKIGKAGFALDISDRHAFRGDTTEVEGRHYSFWEWETQFWPRPIDETAGGDPVFASVIDTTFALYDQRYYDEKHFMRAVRVAGRFTAKHLPWYADTTIDAAEARLYSETEAWSNYMKAPRD